MSDAHSYTYAVLRYYHDIATGECVNVGVALVAPTARFVGARCTASASRAAALFPDLNRDTFLSALRVIEARFDDLGKQAKREPSSFREANVSTLTTSVLAPDASSLKWASMGSGLTPDPARELARLFERMVTRYEPVPDELTVQKEIYDYRGNWAIDFGNQGGPTSVVFALTHPNKGLSQSGLADQVGPMSARSIRCVIDPCPHIVDFPRWGAVPLGAPDQGVLTKYLGSRVVRFGNIDGWVSSCPGDETPPLPAAPSPKRVPADGNEK